MSLETDVLTLQRQVVHFLTAAQINALISSLQTNNTTLTNLVNALTADVATLQAEVQSLKDQLADHETRITALE